MSYARGDKLQQKTEDLVEKADAFVEENQELVGEAGPDTLGRIVVHGAPIAAQLSELVKERSRLAVDANNALATAINGQQATPKEMYKLEVLVKVRKREYERVNDAMSRLISFLEGVTDLLNTPEEVSRCPEKPEPNSYKPSLWRRIFG